MANKKKKSVSSKKKSTTKKSNSAVKRTGATKSVKSTPKKSSSASKKTSVKSTTAKKKTAPKKTGVKLVTKEPVKVERKTKVKTNFKEVSKNNNKPQQVIKTEDYTVIKKKAPVEGKKRIAKSNAKKVEYAKRNSILKTFGKLRRKIRMYGINSVIPVKYISIAAGVLAVIVLSIITMNLFGGSAKLDLSSIPDKIDKIPTVTFDINNVGSILSSSNAYGQLKDYYEYDFKDVIGLNPSYVTSYVIKVNKAKKQAFVAIKPVSEHYDDVKASIDKFLKENDVKSYEFLQYQGYQIYIKSSNDEAVISKIKQSQQRIFNIMKDLKKDDIEREFKISDSEYDEALVKTPMVVKSDTCGYAIFKPKNQSSKEKIKNLMEDYYKGLEAKWQNNEENKRLVQNRYFEEYKGYLIYIVSRDNNLAIQLLKS